MFQFRTRLGSVSESVTSRRAVRVTVVAGVLVSWVAAASAQLPAPARPPKGTEAPAQLADLPAARTILDRHVAAIGGSNAVLGHSATSAKGTVTIPAAGISGTLEVYAAKPNKSFVKVSLQGVGEIEEGFDGTHAWSVSPMTGPMLHDGRQLEEKRFDAEFHGELKPETRYSSMTTLEKTEFEGRPCYKVRLVRKTGGEDIEFYDVETGLKAGSIITRETHMGAVTSTTVETDYRKFGDLLQATTFKQRIGPVEQVMQITSIEYDNVPVSTFEMPAAIKALIK